MSTSKLVLGHSECSDVLDGVLQLRNVHAVRRFDGEDAFEDLVELKRDWEDLAKEVVVEKVRPEGLVGDRGRLPWITAASEVYEDDTKSPDVVGSSVVGHGLDVDTTLTFWNEEKIR